MNTGVMNIERILAGRTLGRLARRVDILDTTTSTNDHAWAHANDTAADGFVVFAEHQTAGRGRMGRSWISPRGAGVICTTLLIESGEHLIPTTGSLGLIAGIATAHAIVEATGICALIAWPNDIVIRNRKTAGILVETRTLAGGVRACALGIGINCLQHRNHFPADLRARATSLDIESSVAIDRESVAGALLSNLDKWLADPSQWEAGNVRAAFMACALPIGRSIRLRYEGQVYSGQVLDIDPSAALVVQLDAGARRLFPAAGTSVVTDA